MRWFALQHVPFEGPGYLETWANKQWHGLTRVKMWEVSTLPCLSEFDGLFVLGGSMGAGDDDKFPWLAAEKHLISQALSAGKFCVGICLGAQLLSLVAGGTVSRNEYLEIGWFPVQRTPTGSVSRLWDAFPKEFMAFHWHSDQATIPPGAVHLASSRGCVEQAFAIGDRVLALQFHLEATPATIDELISHCPSAREAEYVQSPGVIRSLMQHATAANCVLEKMLNRLCGLSGKQVPSYEERLAVAPEAWTGR